jgi:Ser/Thr protein kinase RdoA (MazF antagonist)
MDQTSAISNNISEILSQFLIGEVNSIVPYGTGHINETYFVKSVNANDTDYLLQRINHQIFKNVSVLIKNILTVTAHLRKKLEAIAGANPDQEVLTLVSTRNGEYYYHDSKGDYWRMYYFLDANSYDILENQQQAYQGGRAFGKFQCQLVDLNVNLIQETIPNFHNVQLRYNRFEQVIQGDKANSRAQNTTAEIAFVRERAENMVQAWQKLLQLPVRVIHNDTKFNNVLLNKDDRVQCVIDLDTVMPGYVAYDFGDAIRTIINTAAEDEKNLDKINLNIPFFESYTQGYLEEAASFLTNEEAESLLTGVYLITYEQIVRFLTDYLENDVYYKTHFPEHNLQRTQAQIELLKKLEASGDELLKIIKGIIKKDKLISN